MKRALAELRRVLRPGGAFHFIEHGRSPDPNVARGTTGSRRSNVGVFGRCHLNRPNDDLLRGAGLELSQLQNFSTKGPKAFGYMFEGVATKL